MRRLSFSLIAASTVAALAAGSAAWGLPATPTRSASLKPATSKAPASKPPASKAPASKAATSTSITNYTPVGLPAGDYLLSVRVTSTATYPVPGAVYQRVGGVGNWDRVAEFTASLSGTTVQAQIRVTGPLDTFVAFPYGPAVETPLTLTPAAWGYLVRGTTITSPTSTGVIWHGVNSNPDLPIPSGIQALAANTRANSVRVAVFEYQWLPFFTAAYVPGYRQHMIDTVNAITAAGMTAIVVLGAAGHDNPTLNPGYANGGQLGPDQHSIAFWQDAAGLWGNNPHVVFELFNEPQMSASDIEPGGLTGAQVWRNGGTLTYGDTWTAPGMQQLTDTIRATGADNLILIDGTDWAASLLPVEKTPIDGTNLAYAFHVYTYGTEDPTVAPTYLASTVAPVIDPAGYYRFAAVATEFGTKQQDTGVAGQNPGSSYLINTAHWISGYGAGWLVWGWYPHTYDAYGLLWSFPLNLMTRSQTVVGLM